MDTVLNEPDIDEPLQALGPMAPAAGLGEGAHDEWLSRAQAHSQRLEYAQAAALCEQGLALFPKSPMLWSELASAYLQQGALQAAELGFRSALNFAPGNPELLFGVAVCLQRQSKVDPARELLEAVVQLSPEHHRAWNNLATILECQGRYLEQQRAIERALSLEPANPSYTWNRAVARLRQGQFAQGWADYEARYLDSPRPPTPKTWTGEPAPHATLFVACEQGLGDTLQFMRFLPWARQRVGRLIICCPSALKPFLESQGCADEVIAGDGTPPPDMLSIRLMSLPHLMGLKTPADIATQPYLHAPADRVQAMACRFANRRRPFIALSWQGSKKYGADAQRSMPLHHLLPILRGWDATFFSVQKGEGSEQLADLPPDVHVEPLRPADDADGAFLDTAALLSHCDLFITTDSAVAHLAGGLGVPTQLLLPYAPDWRWGTREQPLQWYERVEMVFQPQAGDWATAVQRLLSTETAQKAQTSIATSTAALKPTW
jgi:tetratricopeptide (TPR) repeat protein